MPSVLCNFNEEQYLYSIGRVVVNLICMQDVLQDPFGMIALRSVPAQMREYVNWMDLVYALKDLLDPTAHRKVFRAFTVYTRMLAHTFVYAG